MCSDSQSSCWKFLVGKYLGKSVARKWKQFYLDVKAVDLGVKPAYLYDIGPPVGHKLQSLIEESVQKSLIISNLNIVEIGMDCLIVNPESVQQIKGSFENINTDFESLQIKIVDITDDSKTILDSSKAVRAEVHEAVNDIVINVVSGKVHLYVLSDSLICNRTALFGVLLGYPVVYWFDESKTKTQHYLSMVPLQCVTVTSKITVGGQNAQKEIHNLYSFSYPFCHKAKLKEFITAWFVKLDVKCKHTMFENLSIANMEKCFEAVAL